MLQKRTVCGIDVNTHCKRYLESVAALVNLTVLQVNVPTDIYVFIYLFTNVVLVTTQRQERIP